MNRENNGGRLKLSKRAFITFMAGLIALPATALAEQPALPVSVKFVMNDEGLLFVRIINSRDGEFSFRSNLEAVLASEFLGFPKQGFLQFRKQDPWISIATYSSQADPPDMAANLSRIKEIQLRSGETKEFRVDYSRAIDIATTRIADDRSMPTRFRVKLPFDYSDEGNRTKVVVVSEWFSCEKLIKTIIKARNENRESIS